MPAGFFESPIDLALPDIPQGIPPELFNEFYRIYTAFHTLQSALNRYAGIVSRDANEWSTVSPLETVLSQNLNRLYIQASENLPFGALLNIFNSSGVMKARNANATNNTKPCYAICNTVGGIAPNSFGEVILMQGLSIGIAGMVVGLRYWLSTTDGTATNIAPVAAGNIQQPIGIALASNLLFFTPSLSWVQL